MQALKGQVGRQAVRPVNQRNAMFRRPVFVGTAAELGLKPVAPGTGSRGVPTTVCQAATAAGSSALPWQAAMSEIKKRRDLNTIMIIGAGPIVIGQVERMDRVNSWPPSFFPPELT